MDSLQRWLDLARSLLSAPTAPLFEELPRECVREFVANRPELQLVEDAAGNMRVDLLRGGADQIPLVLVAHLDHPGFHVESVDGDHVNLRFEGWLDAKHGNPGAPIQFFERGKTAPTGEGRLIASQREPGPLKSSAAQITSGSAVEEGYAMWAFPGFSVENDTIVTRCCDDLLGAAAALCVLDEILRLAPPRAHLIVLFTRAEEIGFLGTLEAIRLQTIPRNSCVLSLECSKAAGIVKQGDGVIVRVGDAASIFDPGLTAALSDFARKLAAKDAGFLYQRKLMDGGVCEATPFCAHGYRASGLALPLHNYHNQAFDEKGAACVGPETVRVNDFAAEIRLLTELAQHPEALESKATAPSERLQTLAKKARELLTR